MALVTMIEASAITGLSVKSLYAASTRSKNPLTTTKNSDNVKVVDTAELLRVYGDRKRPAATAPIPAVEPSYEHIELLLAQQKIEHLQELLSLKDKQIGILEHSMQLLEHKPERKTGFLSRLFNTK
jgi:hypothetical protein